MSTGVHEVEPGMTSDVPACRRTVLRGAAVVGAAGAGLTGLTACGGKKDSGVPSTPIPLGETADVPVGGAKLYRDDKVLVSQPVKGTFKAFSAVCTHQGCVLDEVSGDAASCPCHGSRFDTGSGAVLQGPATRPLTPVKVTVSGSTLTVG
jgi:Rieske Fe-S protein